MGEHIHIERGLAMKINVLGKNEETKKITATEKLFHGH